MLGDRFYNIDYLSSVVKKDIPSLPTAARILIKRAIEERLMVDPIGWQTFKIQLERTSSVAGER